MASADKKCKPRGFRALLSLAVCEWVLMFLLFVNATLSYLLTKFAQYCELETPCLFCSRFDYGFGKKKPGFYWSLLCSSHRDEISTLVSCSVHGKFADVNGLCEECLVPLIMQENSSSETFRFLMVKSWVDVDRSVLQYLLVNKNVRSGSDHRICSCCGKSWKAKANAERLLELNSVANVAAKTNLKPPLPRTPRRSRFSRKESLKRLRHKVTEKSRTAGNYGFDTPSRLGPCKKKSSSHSDTEAMLSEDEGDGKMSHCETHSEPDYDAQGDINGLQIPIVNNAVPEKLIHQDCTAEPLIFEQPYLLDLSEHKHISSSLPSALTEHGQKRPYNNPSSYLKLISLDDGTKQLDTAGGSFGVSAEIIKSIGSHPQMPSLKNATPILTKVSIGRTSEQGDAQWTEAAAETTSDFLHSLKLNDMHQADPLNQRVLSDKHKSSVGEDSSSKVLLVSHFLTKNDPYDETLDGITGSDVEGESILDKLKLQVENDRIYINSLCRELEEERNASAIAANQAMAMITKLQEEKALLHMEALQYLRMMEEQAEYDTDALAKANDLLAEREKELQDKEYELDYFREYADDDLITAHAASHNSTAAKVLNTNKNGSLVNGLVSSTLEESKTFIFQCLKTLEKRLQQVYASAKLDDMNDALGYEKTKAEENGCLCEKSDKHSSNHGETDYVHFIKEIAELRVRLEALETDCNFLKCTSDLLQSEEDGFQLVQEIAHQLQELRKMQFGER